MCKHQQWFGLDVQCSAIVLNLNNIFSIKHLYRAGQSMNSLPSQILERYTPLFMKFPALIIFFLTFVACNNSNLQTQKAILKSVHIPDTTNNWYAKLFDYPNYARKTVITKQLSLDNLEADTSNSEIRIWTIGSNYNPQTLIYLKTKTIFGQLPSSIII